MMRSWLVALPLGLALASPAAAVSFCDDHTSNAGVTFSMGFHVGAPYTEAEQATFDQMALRRQGIDATRVERWNGCLRAWVRRSDGTESMEFYDPNTLRRLDLTLR